MSFNIDTASQQADDFVKEFGSPNLKIQAGAFDICSFYKKARPVLSAVSSVLSFLPFISSNIGKAVTVFVQTMDAACNVN